LQGNSWHTGIAVQVTVLSR